MLQFHNISFLYEVNLINVEYVKNVGGKKPLLIFLLNIVEKYWARHMRKRDEYAVSLFADNLVKFEGKSYINLHCILFSTHVT